MEQNFILAAFDSTHDAIKAESIMNKAGLTARLIPIPPEISAGCGLALRSLPEDEARVRALLSEEGVVSKYFSLKRDGIRRIVKPLEE